MLTPPLLLAALSAGLLGGVHCIGMCGGISSMLSSAGKPARKTIAIIPVTAVLPVTRTARWRVPFFLHSGRIFTYMLMGAVAGAFGALGMRFHPVLPVHTLMYIFGNLALIWLGLRLFGYTPHFAPLDKLIAKATTYIHLSPRLAILKQTQRFPFLVGMIWGLLPCGLVFGVLPFALLSGHATSGAILLLLFGFSALPHLLFAQTIANWMHSSRIPIYLRRSGAALLTGIGLLGLWWSFNMSAMPAFLCVTVAA
jgi:sulfite exporter TauE/SafE